MQRELVLMTKPKHKNVLVVHGMCVLGSARVEYQPSTP
jgi:hypothetical protein